MITLRKSFLCTSIIILYKYLYSFIYGYFKLTELSVLSRDFLYITFIPIIFLCLIRFCFRFDFFKLKRLLILNNRQKLLSISLHSVLIYVALTIIVPAMLFFLWFIVKSEPIRVFYYETSLLFILNALVIAPLFEELFFRRIIAYRLFKKYGFLKAVVYSAFLFMLMHIPNSISHLLISFIVGLLLAFIFLKTRNIYLTISLHSLSNLYVIIDGNYPHFIAFWLDRSYNNGTGLHFFWLYYVITFIIIILLSYNSIRYLNKYHAKYINK